MPSVLIQATGCKECHLIDVDINWGNCTSTTGRSNQCMIGPAITKLPAGDFVMG